MATQMTLNQITLPADTKFFPLNENAQYKGTQVIKHFALQVIKDFNKRQKELIGYVDNVANVNLVTTSEPVANRQFFFEFNDEDVTFSDLFFTVDTEGNSHNCCNLSGYSNTSGGSYWGRGTYGIDFFKNYYSINTVKNSSMAGDSIIVVGGSLVDASASSTLKKMTSKKDATTLLLTNTMSTLNSDEMTAIQSGELFKMSTWGSIYSGDAGSRTATASLKPMMLVSFDGTAFVPEVIDGSYTGNLATINGNIQIVISLFSYVISTNSISTDPNPKWHNTLDDGLRIFFKDGTHFRGGTSISNYMSYYGRKQDLINMLNCVGIPFTFDEANVQLPISEIQDGYDPNAKYIPPNYVPEPYYLTKSLTKNECYTFDEENGYQRVPVEEVTLETIKQYGGRVPPTCNETLQEFGDFQLYMYDELTLFEPEIQSTGTMFTPIHTRNLNVEHQIVSATMTAEQLSDIVILKDGFNYYFNGSEWIQDDKVFTTQEVFNSITEEQWALLGAGIYNIHPILLSAYSSFKSITVSYF